MNNLFNKRQRVPSLIEEAMMGRMYDEPREDEDKKSKTNIVVRTNRLYYGEKSTISAFQADAYDEQGNKVDSMEGYFLEPGTDFERAKKAGSDTAIMSGGYEIIPKMEMLKRVNERREKEGLPKVKELGFTWYIDNPPGRSGIAIHGGRNGGNTTGCFIPGSSFNFDEHIQDYTINNRGKREELFNFFDKYGQNGIKINVGPHFEYLYK